jgi:nitrogen fixation protein NifU and related proteins
MAELKRLYDDVIMDHIKNARNYHELKDANRTAEGFNPLCGDKITVYVKLEEELIRDIGFVCSSCGISMASASIMTEKVKGRSKAESMALGRQLTELLAHASSAAEPPLETGPLAMLAVVREFPARINCATLAWHTLNAALEGRQESFTMSEESGAGAEHPR